QARQERDRTCQAIQFGDDQRHLPHPSRSKSLIQFGAIRSATAFDLNKLADNPPVAAVEVVFDRLPLRLNAEAAFALLAASNPVVSEKTAVRDHCPLRYNSVNVR